MTTEQETRLAETPPSELRRTPFAEFDPQVLAAHMPNWEMLDFEEGNRWMFSYLPFPKNRRIYELNFEVRTTKHPTPGTTEQNRVEITRKTPDGILFISTYEIESFSIDTLKNGIHSVKFHQANDDSVEIRDSGDFYTGHSSSIRFIPFTR